MVMRLEGVLSFAHSMLQLLIQSGDTVIDATMGNGFDSLFLASQVGPTGTVLAYDIQEEAIKETRELLQKENCLNQTHLYLKGHQTVQQELSQISSPIAAAMFNLGYRPMGDKDVVTKPATTIKALHSIVGALRQDGMITLVMYPGHEHGRVEGNAIVEEIKTWDQSHFQILQYQFINQKNSPPFLIAIQKV